MKVAHFFDHETGEMMTVYLDANGPPFEPTRQDLLSLINWLAMPYVNQPVWRAEGQPPVPGEGNLRDRLKATWEYLGLPMGPEGPGAWAQCNLCGMWQVVAERTEDGQAEG